MAIFKLNDINPVDPGSFLKECRRLKIGTSKWLGKANSFVFRRGLEASVGHFLFPGNNIPKGNVNLRVDFFKTTLKGGTQSTGTGIIEGLQVQKTEAVTNSREESGAVHLVTVIDPVIEILKHKYVSKNYNIALDYKQEITGSIPQAAEIIYDPDSQNPSGGSGGNTSSPWTWTTLLDDILPGIDKSKADFPIDKPQGLMFRDKSVKEALEYITLVTGHVLIRKFNKTLTIEPGNPSNIDDTLSSFDKFMLVDHSHKYFDTYGRMIPSKINYHFPVISLKDNLSKFSEKQTKTVNSTLRPIAGVEWDVRMPLYINADNAQNRTDLVTKLQANYERGWNERASNLVDKIYATFIDLDPSQEIYSVVWYDLSNQVPRTQVTTSSEPVMPKHFIETDGPELMFLATVDQQNTDPSTGKVSYKIKDIDIISGEYRSITSGTSNILDVRAKFDQTFDPEQKVIVVRNKSSGNFEAWKPSGGDASIKYFGLRESMSLKDTYALAGDIVNNPNSSFDFGIVNPNVDADYYVLDSNELYTGKPSVDKNATTVYEDQAYRGHAILVTDNYIVNNVPTGKSGYRIIQMEHPARMLLVKLVEDQGKDGSTSSALQGDPSKATRALFYKAGDVAGWGLAPQGRLPQTIEGELLSATTTYDLKVYDHIMEVGFKAGAKSGEIWWVIYNDWWDRYDFFKPMQSNNYVRIKGKTTGSSIQSSDSTFAINNIEVLNGLDPRDDPKNNSEVITIKNDPPITITDNTEFIYAIFDKTVGSGDVKKQWTTADMGNFSFIIMAWFMDQQDFGISKKQYFVHLASQRPGKWNDRIVCTTPPA